MPCRVLWVAVVLAAGWSATGRSQERLAVLVTFDTEQIGPQVVCDGAFQTSAGRLALREWLHDNGDAIDGARYTLRTSHNAKTAAQAKGIVRGSSIAKGLLLEIDAPAAATLTAQTKLGDFSIALADLRRERSLSKLDGKLHLQCAAVASALTGDQAEEEYPSLAALPDGRTATAYVAWDGKSDRVLLRTGEKTTEVSAGPGDYLEPRCGVDGRGRLWVVWSAGDGRKWDLWAWREGERQRLTTAAGNHFWPRLAKDRHGRLWLAWQTAAADRHYEIQLAELTDAGLGPVLSVSEHPADDWEPALCATPDGRLAVAWDTYRNGSFDVYLREFSTAPAGPPKPLGLPRPVAASPKREAHVTLAADSKSRIWLAWDVGVADWGKHPERGATLHSSRSVDIACLADGKLWRPAALADALPPAWTRSVEYPQVAVDADDRPWVFYRVQNTLRPLAKPAKARGSAQTYGMWLVFASVYEGGRWSPPALLPYSNGRQDMRIDVARDPAGGLLAAYAADGRTRLLPYVPVDYDVFLASLRSPSSAPGKLQLTPAEDLAAVTPLAPDAELAPLPRTWSVAGRTYRLVLGDTHRHTDISRCNNGGDGSLQDAYRYALDTCELDWLAISDHDQDILKHRADRKPRPRQDYDWQRSQKYCDLYSIPGRFVALYGYEHGGSYADRGGHKNVVGDRRGRDVYEVDAPHELFAALAESGCLVIPHQLADAGSRTDWEKWSDKFERVGEIFQIRGSYEFEGCPRSAAIFTKGNSLWDALAKGVRIGIIASSDHGQTHQARAGVYVEEKSELGFTRQGILEALRARRTFGATVAVTVQVNAGGRLLGEEFAAPGPPTLDVRIAAPAPIARIDVVRDNRFVYSQQPAAKEARFRFRDADLPPGQSAYYYVRAQIGESDFAWSSPLWITRKPD